MAKHCHECLHYEVCRLLIGERELYINDMACRFPESCGGYKKKADYTEVVRCKDCKHWIHMEDGFGDCTNRRFHLDGHADPSMKMDDFCSCGERR